MYRQYTSTSRERPIFSRTQVATLAIDYYLTSKGELTCFSYSKLGYYKSNYSKGPSIKEIVGLNIDNNLE